MNNNLITSGGRRVSLVRAFKNGLASYDKNAKVITVDSNHGLSAASQIADGAFSIPAVDNRGYLDALLKICRNNNIKIIVPTIDTELQILSDNVDLLLDNGIIPVISAPQLIETFNNKRKTNLFFKDKGIQVAKEYSKKSYKLPLFINKVNGCGSKDVSIIKNRDDFRATHFKDDSYIFMEYIDKEIFDEYTCDTYYDRAGNLKCVVPRKRLEVRAGEISKGLTVKNELIDFIKKYFVKIDGAKGCLTMQFFKGKVSSRIIGIEINPRFGGGYPLSYMAGANFPKWIIDEYMLNKDIPIFENWEENLLMLRYDDELLVRNYNG